MLISKKVLIKKRGNKNIKYYTDLGYDTSLDKFEIDIIHLTESSKYLVYIECDFCGNHVERMYYLYLKNISSNGLFACSPKCGKNKTINTNLEKYGFEYPNQSELVKNKTRETNIEKYGVDSPMKSELVKNKIKETNLERWGVEWTLQNKDIRNKIKETNLERWGVDHNFKSPITREKIKETLLKNWGVDNPSKSDEIKDKKRDTCIKNWGVDNPNKSEVIKEKKKETNLERLGVEFPMQNKEVRDKSKKTLLEKYGVEHNSKLYFVKESMKINNLEKWGVEYTLQSKEIRDKIEKTNLEKWGSNTSRNNDKFRKNNFIISKDKNYIKYLGENSSLFSCVEGHEFEIISSNYHSRISSNLPLCTVCYPIGDSISIKEEELYKFISSVYDGEVIQSYRDGLEIDIYLPDLKLGFEFNGLYWHSEKYKSRNYHIDKTNFFKEKGIRIIHIWEDDWDFNRDILESQIINWIGSTPNKIFARKCSVRILDSVSNFLNNNHIQGVDKSSLKLGLYYNDELVSVMTFDRFEGRTKMEEGGWNLSRFCNKRGFNIVGGASKLLNYFIKNWNPTRIVSYADRDWSDGGLYYQLGFSMIKESKPDYKYFYESVRTHKSNFKKSKLKYECTESEYMNSIGIYRIWDCGKIKFEKVTR
jgi:hypothetical protein